MAVHVILSDTQIPFEDRRSINSFTKWLEENGATSLTIIGDFLDVPGPARWNRGTAEEFTSNLQAECDKAKDYLKNIRAAYDGPIYFHEGNHEKRIKSYITNKAPAFASLEGLRIPKLLGFDEFDIYLAGIYNDIAPGWVTTHGDVAASLSQNAGGTALSIAKRVGKSVICGHTHRLGIQYTSFGIGASTHLCGFEVGHMMNVSKADYIDSGAPNWQKGFGVIEVSGNLVQPIPVIMDGNGKIAYRSTGKGNDV